VIIVSGAAVRLTGSGLGCTDWPNCTEGRLVASADSHELIEFVNRVFTGAVSLAVALANAADGGTRRCISINSAEPTRAGSNARNAGLHTVADITRARLRAVAESVGRRFEELRLP